MATNIILWRWEVITAIAIINLAGMHHMHGHSIYIPDLPPDNYHKLGDFELGVINSVHQYDVDNFCSKEPRDLSLLQRVEALSYVVDEINNRTDILPHHTLGFVMYDDCYKDITALAQSLHFIQRDHYVSCYFKETDVAENCTEEGIAMHEVVGLVLSEGSQAATQMANLFTSFRIPQIAYMATVSTLSNKDSYPSSLRTVPSDRNQAIAIIDLLLHFNFTYVSVVYSEGKYGEEGYKVLNEEASKKDVCFGQVLELKRNFTASDYNLVIYALLLENSARAVVVYTPLAEARQILAASERMAVQGRITWIATDAWARNIVDLHSLESVSVGILSINIESDNVQRFDDHFTSIGPYDDTDNPWMIDYWEAYIGCTTDENRTSLYEKCDPIARFNQSIFYLPDNTVSLVFDTIYAFAYGLHYALMYGDCSMLPQPADMIVCAVAKLGIYLPNISFTGENGQVAFDNLGDVARSYIIYNVQTDEGSEHKQKLTHIATWDKLDNSLHFSDEDIEWSQGEQPTSICSTPCGIGEQQVLLQRRCCWVCEACADDQITAIWDERVRCYDCPLGEWPDQETRTECLPIKPDFVRWHDTLGIIMASIASTGMAGCLVTLMVFILNNGNPLVKASSRELSYLMLTGTFLSYTFVFTFLIKPDDTVCYIRFFGIGLCFSVMYAPLMTKTIRIYRIFEAGKNMDRNPRFVSSGSQLVIVAFIIMGNLLMVGVWSIFEKTTFAVLDGTPGTADLVCVFPDGPFIASLAYNDFLLVMCIFFAFKVRKLPHNYNESRFISFCVYSTVVIWLAFIPAYFTVNDAFLEVMFLSFAILINATVLFICIFLPKVYALYFVDKENLHVKKWKFNFKTKNGTRRLIHDGSISNSEVHEMSVPVPESKKSNTSNVIRSESTNSRASRDNKNEDKDDITKDFSGIIQMQVSPAPESHSIDGANGWL